MSILPSRFLQSFSAEGLRSNPPYRGDTKVIVDRSLELVCPQTGPAASPHPYICGEMGARARLSASGDEVGKDAVMIEQLTEKPNVRSTPAPDQGARDATPMRSILLHIADDDALEARTQVALDLARAFDGHLSCLQAVPYEYGVPGDFYGGMLADMVPILREAAEKLRGQCERRLAPEDVRWSWEHEDGRAHEHLLRRSSLNDIVVVGSREPFSKAPSLLARYLVMRLRTPMLLVPEHVNGLNCAGTAVVAWNGSAEASRALKGALPLLAKARSVVLATVLGEPAREFDLPAVEGAEYLSRHGIDCEMTEFPLEHGSVAEVLTDLAARREAAYLVMGAYGRPRLVETVLGGVTGELLARPPLPVLVCH